MVKRKKFIDPDEDLVSLMKRKLDSDLFKKIMKAKKEVEMNIAKELMERNNSRNVTSFTNFEHHRKISRMSTKGQKAPPKQKGRHNVFYSTTMG